MKGRQVKIMCICNLQKKSHKHEECLIHSLPQVSFPIDKSQITEMLKSHELTLHSFRIANSNAVRTYIEHEKLVFNIKLFFDHIGWEESGK